MTEVIFGSAFLKFGRPRGSGKGFQKVGGEAPPLVEGFPGPPGPARPQKHTPKIRLDCFHILSRVVQMSLPGERQSIRCVSSYTMHRGPSGWSSSTSRAFTPPVIYFLLLRRCGPDIAMAAIARSTFARDLERAMAAKLQLCCGLGACYCC
jgi:hypothetical protein